MQKYAIDSNKRRIVVDIENTVAIPDFCKQRFRTGQIHASSSSLFGLVRDREMLSEKIP
jgi:hypothetical protein